jgi:hypothetical protein
MGGRGRLRRKRGMQGDVEGGRVCVWGKIFVAKLIKKRKEGQNGAACLIQQENDITCCKYYLGCEDSLAASSPPHGLRSCQATPKRAYRGTTMKSVIRSIQRRRKNPLICNTATATPHNTTTYPVAGAGICCFLGPRSLEAAPLCCLRVLL